MGYTERIVAMKRSLLVWFLLVSIAPICCGFAFKQLKVQAKYKEVGEIGSIENVVRAVDKPEDVRLFYANSPAGFSLKENELKVEDGFEHRILGTISIRYKDGHCIKMDQFSENPRNDFFQLMRQKAFEKGANALIYVSSELSGDDDREEFKKLCNSRAYSGTQMELSYASGWAVVVVK